MRTVRTAVAITLPRVLRSTTLTFAVARVLRLEDVGVLFLEEHAGEVTPSWNGAFEQYR